MRLLCLFLNNSNFVLNTQRVCNTLQVRQGAGTKQSFANSGFYGWQWMSCLTHCLSFAHLFFLYAGICYCHTAKLTLKMSFCSGKWLKSIIIFVILTMNIMFAHALWSWWLENNIQTFSFSPQGKKYHARVIFLCHK